MDCAFVIVSKKFLPNPRPQRLFFCTLFCTFLFFFQARLYWGPCCSRGEREQTIGYLACSLPEAGASLFLMWGEGRGVSRGRAGGVAWVFFSPLRWCFVQGACAVPCFCSWPPAFAPGSSKGAVGFFGLFLSFVQNLPQHAHSCPNMQCCPNMHTVIFSPIQFLCILLLEERCVQGQALQHCSKGSQVPACLIPLWETLHPYS